MGNRRKARECALQILFQLDLSKSDFQESVRYFWKFNPPELDEIKEFTTTLVEGVWEHRNEIDRKIESHSTHWKLGRMACVDRNILRIAAYELLFCPEIPKSVSLNEAIELGKKFGTEDSSSFINGVLDHIHKEVKA